MAIIEIDGIGRIEVGDEFKAMSPTDQDAFVQSVIADVGKGKKSSVGTGAPSLGADIAKSAGVGLAQGAISTAGTIGDLRDAGSWIAGKAASLFGASPETAKNVEATVGLLGRLNPISLFAPTSKEIKQAVAVYRRVLRTTNHGGEVRQERRRVHPRRGGGSRWPCAQHRPWHYVWPRCGSRIATDRRHCC